MGTHATVGPQITTLSLCKLPIIALSVECSSYQFLFACIAVLFGVYSRSASCFHLCIKLTATVDWQHQILRPPLLTY